MPLSDSPMIFLPINGNLISISSLQNTVPLATAMATLIAFLLQLLIAFSPAFGANTPNPFTAKAAAIRYWNRKVPNRHPHPSFLLSKLSPLSAADSAAFSSLAAVSSRLPAFCSAAHLLCSPSLSPSLLPGDSHFATYTNLSFTGFANYGTGLRNGGDTFTNYSRNLNSPIDSFRRYSRDSDDHRSAFSAYSLDGNVVTSDFTSYSSNAPGSSLDFAAYHKGSNIPDLGFTSYASNSNSLVSNFTSYSDNNNVGNQSFSNYGKDAGGVASVFTTYSNASNGILSSFDGYGQSAVKSNEKFASYGDNSNFPTNTFDAYGEGNSVGGSDEFVSYRVHSSAQEDDFSSYDKAASFAKYGNYFDRYGERIDSFKGYDKGNHTVDFKAYAKEVVEFKGYRKTGATFTTYKNSSTVLPPAAIVKEERSGRFVNIMWVEPGKFFRESSLKNGTAMPMPDIRDKMPERSFLPRPIAGKIPFSAAGVDGALRIPAGTALGRAVADTVAECERAPSRGETKRCATSAEDMIDFAVSVLGPDIVVRSTESTAGSKGDVLIGDVRGINGGEVTKSVSCHQSLFPYLVYYCHSVPKVRVYEAEILSVETKDKINRGVAICHVDTSDWSAGHGAFVALGSGPGKIEVCHWIFEGDMTWAKAD